MQEAFVKIGTGPAASRPAGAAPWAGSSPSPATRRSTRSAPARRRRGTSPRCSTSPTRADPGGERARVPTTGGGSRAASGRCRATGRRRWMAAYVEGWSYEELAWRFDVPLNTMRTWLRRALISLEGVPRVMTDTPDLPDDLPDDPDAALAGEYVLRLLGPEETAACARARRAIRPSRRSSRLAARPRAARRRLCRGGAAGGAGAADRRAALRRAALGPRAPLGERRPLAGGGRGGRGGRGLARRPGGARPGRSARRGSSRRSPPRAAAT